MVKVINFLDPKGRINEALVHLRCPKLKKTYFSNRIGF